MSFDRKTSLTEAWNITTEMMEQHHCRIPPIDPDFMRALQLVVIKTAISMHSNNRTVHNVDQGLEIGLIKDESALRSTTP